VSQAPRIVVALDFPTQAQALALVDRLDPGRCALKVGKELFTRAGPALVETLVGRGYRVFLDLKFHDIPYTVAAACDAAADLGVWMVNLHASGGRRMMEAARERLAAHANPPLLIAVTVLTSMDGADLAEIGCPDEPLERVLRLARLTQAAGLAGIVCSPQEAARVRSELGPGFILVTPGVRPASAAAGDQAGARSWPTGMSDRSGMQERFLTSDPGIFAVRDDQKRVMTPREALVAGADYLVVGRPITAADDPMAAFAAIEVETLGA
jgi:orotidine-5'-phosphate decarboxylase